MRRSIKEGLSFGLTSGVITPLGLMMGLNTSTGSRIAIIGGILTIAIADALSDALGMHMSEESNKKNSHKAVWESTIATFLAKFLIAISFLVPFVFFSLGVSIVITIVWGLLLLIFFNYLLAKDRGESPIEMIRAHLILAIIVLVISHYAGKIIAKVLIV